MTFKEFIKPTWWRILTVVIVFVLWILFLKFSGSVINCDCQPYGFFNCTDYYSYMIYSGFDCHCTCISLETVFLNYFWFGLIPLIIIYLIVNSIFYSVGGFRN